MGRVRWRIVGGVIALLAIGAAGGFAYAWTTIGKGPRPDGVGPHSWQSSTNIGTARTDPIRKAVIARTGIWALPATEVIYYSADEDAEGRALDRRCVYEIAGVGDPPARWWSISLYRDNFWVDNPGDRYSFSQTTVTRDAAGAWRVRVAGAPQSGDWIPMGDRDGRFALSFRLYHPEPSVAADLKATPLPPIRRLSCA